jgi:hypothetical protein
MFCGSPLNLCGCPLSNICSHARKYVVVILANIITDIADGVSPFMPYCDLDEDMWDDMGSGIAHLSLLNLVLARGCPLNVLYGLG